MWKLNKKKSASLLQNSYSDLPQKKALHHKLSLSSYALHLLDQLKQIENERTSLYSYAGILLAACLVISSIPGHYEEKIFHLEFNQRYGILISISCSFFAISVLLLSSVNKAKELSFDRIYLVADATNKLTLVVKNQKKCLFYSKCALWISSVFTFLVILQSTTAPVDELDHTPAIETTHCILSKAGLECRHTSQGTPK